MSDTTTSEPTICGGCDQPVKGTRGLRSHVNGKKATQACKDAFIAADPASDVLHLGGPDDEIEAPTEQEPELATEVDDSLEQALRELAEAVGHPEPEVTQNAAESVVAEAEKITEQASVTPRNVQRMTVKIPVDVDLGAWSERFGVTGWIPTRESLVAYVEALLLNSPAVTDGQIVNAQVK